MEISLWLSRCINCNFFAISLFYLTLHCFRRHTSVTNVCINIYLVTKLSVTYLSVVYAVVLENIQKPNWCLFWGLERMKWIDWFWFILYSYHTIWWTRSIENMCLQQRQIFMATEFFSLFITCRAPAPALKCHNAMCTRLHTHKRINLKICA